MTRRSFSRRVVVFAALWILAGCATSRPQPGAAAKTYVITGASSGFGRGVAVKLGGQGANVVLAARRTELLEEVARDVRAAGGTPLVVTTDVSKAAEITRLAQATVKRFGRIDVWINNAGVGVISRFWDAPDEDYSRLVDVNLKGVIYGSRAAINQFRAQGQGTLVNVGSVESEVPLAYQAVYAATKAGVLALGRALNEELRLDGRASAIKVATVLPWAADTPFWTHAANYSGGTAQIGSMDDPQKVVEVIVRATQHPREEMPAGWKARASYLGHRLAPDATERFAANLVHHYQIKTAPPAPTTSGSLHQPMFEGRKVEGGVRARMQQEEQSR